MRRLTTICGLTSWLGFPRQLAGFAMLTYHRILERRDPYYDYHVLLSAFEQHLRCLRRFCAVVSLDTALDCLERGRSLPRRCVVLTFDDGYREFSTMAWPLLQRFQLPAVLYVAVEALERGWLWPDLLRYAIRTTARRSVTIEALAEPPAMRWVLETETDRVRAILAIESQLKRMPDGLKWRALEELAWTFLGSRLETIRIPELMLSWEQLEAVSRDGVTVGAHTVTHPILAQVSDEQARSEIAGSKAALQQRLGRPIEHFCYPNGQAADFSDAHEAMARAAGFRSACSTLSGVNQHSTNRFSLRRIDAVQCSLRPMLRLMIGRT